jgi:hypothetical protein
VDPGIQCDHKNYDTPGSRTLPGIFIGPNALLFLSAPIGLGTTLGIFLDHLGLISCRKIYKKLGSGLPKKYFVLF